MVLLDSHANSEVHEGDLVFHAKLVVVCHQLSQHTHAVVD